MFIAPLPVNEVIFFRGNGCKSQSGWWLTYPSENISQLGYYWQYMEK
jgi:hypothetical protein